MRKAAAALELLFRRLQRRLMRIVRNRLVAASALQGLSRNTSNDQLTELRLACRRHRLDYSDAPDMDPKFPGDSLQMKEMIFQRILADYQQHEKTIAVRWHMTSFAVSQLAPWLACLQMNPTKGRIGQNTMAPDQIEGLLLACVRIMC